MASDRAARRILGCAAPLVAVVAFAGCSDGDDAASIASSPIDTAPLAMVTNPPETSAPATSTTSIPEAAATSAPSTTDQPVEPAPPDPVPPDPAATLGQALGAVADGYHFTTTVTTGDVEALTAEGDRVADRTRMSITSNGATVSYVVTPEATWVEEGGTWQELDQASPVTDPLGALGAPQQVVVAESADDRVVLLATYAASALGLPGEGTIDVTVEVVGGALTALAYTDPASSPPSSVRTQISALVDASPVTIPTT